MAESDFDPNAKAANPLQRTPLGNTNRGNDNAVSSQDARPVSITLESVNQIILDYMRNRIAPKITEDGAERLVPIEFGNAERWMMVRKDGFVRDPNNGKLLTPLIMLRRIRETRGQFKNPVNKYIYETVPSGWNRHYPYDAFNLLNGLVPSQQVMTVVVPDYMDLEYEVVMWTSYQEQMDKLIEQINFEAEDYWGERNNYKFRVKIEEYVGASQLPATEDRIVRSEFRMTVAAYLLPTQALQNFKYQSTTKRSFTPKVVTFQEQFITSLKDIGFPSTGSVPGFETNLGTIANS